MTKEYYYYSPQRLICKKDHNYTECLQPEICPNGYCEDCNIDYLSLDELGQSHLCTSTDCNMFGSFLND